MSFILVCELPVPSMSSEYLTNCFKISHMTWSETHVHICSIYIIPVLNIHSFILQCDDDRDLREKGSGKGSAKGSGVNFVLCDSILELSV